MIPDLLVCSFYTPTWEYPAHAKRLKAECDALGVPCRIDELPDQGDYIKNCRLKPAFLAGVMREEQRPLLWVDVDGSLLARPDALRDDVDFMARPMPPERKRQWHVGTLFFHSTEPASVLLYAWTEALSFVSGSDERALDWLWQNDHEDVFGGVRVADLPPEYFQVLGRRHMPAPNAVVVHRLSSSASKRAYHASRR